MLFIGCYHEREPCSFGKEPSASGILIGHNEHKLSLDDIPEDSCSDPDLLDTQEHGVT